MVDRLASGAAACFAALTIASLALVGGCSNGSDDEDDGISPDSGIDSGDPGQFGDGGRDAGCPMRCSSDLHQILDCNNQVLATCPEDQGCGEGGECIPACESAKANKSTYGCEYYSVVPDTIRDGWGACFAAFVANTWNTDVTLTAEFGDESLDVSKFAYIPSGNGTSLEYTPLPDGKLPAGQVAILFLNRFALSGAPFDFNCPSAITAAVMDEDGATHGTGRGKAFHITADRPVTAYDMFPFGGGRSAATSATLLLPTAAWDTNYVAVNAFRPSLITAGQPFLQIVAAEDATKVTISPTSAIRGSADVPGTAKGVPVDYVMSRGQVLQIVQFEELTGSIIQSDKPIGVWGGATCLNIDVDWGACDSAHQELPPVKALGHEYVAVRYRNRLEGFEEIVPWRIVGAVDGTKLEYAPARPKGAPTKLASGQVAEFWTDAAFVVRSQDADHPFYMSGHMTGSDAIPSADFRGDPEFVNVVPTGEYLTSYTFFTDPTYPETNLVVVRAKSGGHFENVILDCAGPLGDWQEVGEYQYTRVDLVKGNFQPQGDCDNGRHTIHSAAPFGLTVWGWGNGQTFPFNSEWVSYAYPAGQSVRPINAVVVPPVPK